MMRVTLLPNKPIDDTELIQLRAYIKRILYKGFFVDSKHEVFNKKLRLSFNWVHPHYRQPKERR